MELLGLPAEEGRLRALQLSRTRRIFRIDPVQMADRMSDALVQLDLDVEAVDSEQVLLMESGHLPIPLPISCAAQVVLDDSLAALEEMIEGLRLTRREPTWLALHTEVG